MKKVISLFITGLLSFILINGSTYALDARLDIVEENGKYKLNILDDNDNILDYNKVVEEDDNYTYFTIYHNHKDLYFYLGNEITKEEYISGYDSFNADKLALQYGESAIRVHNTDEVINNIKDIYDKRLEGKYYLVYSDSEYKNINWKEVEKFYSDNYLTTKSKNLYRYEEYGIYAPSLTNIKPNDNVLEIETFGLKITYKEEKLVEEFLEYFTKLFKDKSNYEKVLGTYIYLSNTLEYQTDNGYDNLLDGVLSPYDTIFTNKTVCIGTSTTFQLIMERLGINSYIVDTIVDEPDGNSYGSVHTYNLVELDGVWYIVDINYDGDLSGLLLKSNNNKFSEKLNLSDKDYLEIYPDANTSFDFKYKDIENYKKIILTGDKKSETLNNRKEELESEKGTAYLVLIVTILSLFIIILSFSLRMKKSN